MKNRFVEVATLSFTGDVEKDFGSKAGVVIVEDPGECLYFVVRLRNTLISCVCAGKQKVGLPPGFAALGLAVSGWDIKDIRFSFDYR
jgi:hypothetical protein